jgi:histidyl-tRNA synthetase
MNIPYQIDKMLVRGLSYYTHTVFEIIEQRGRSKMTIAGGGRYDYLGKQLGSKKDVPAMGGSIGMDRIVEATMVSRPHAAHHEEAQGLLHPSRCTRPNSKVSMLRNPPQGTRTHHSITL